jgi:hypothetical protein
MLLKISYFSASMNDVKTPISRQAAISQQAKVEPLIVELGIRADRLNFA